MPASSLLQMAKRQAIRSIDTITDIGDLPYDFVRPILLKLENPEQLRELEKRCPQIAGEDAEIWKKFLKRDVLNWEKKLQEPSNPKSWSKVYRRLKQESEHEFLQQEEALRAALQVRADEKAKNTTTISTKVIDPEGRRRRVNHNHSSRFGQPSASARADNARGAIDRIKRQTQEARMRRNASLMTPTNVLQSRSSGVRKAPAGMVVEHELQQRQQMPLQRLQQQDNKPNRKVTEPGTKTMIAPRQGSVLQLRQNQEFRKQNRKPGISGTATEWADPTDLASREARLKTLKDGVKMTSPTRTASVEANLDSSVLQINESKQSDYNKNKKNNAQSQHSSPRLSYSISSNSVSPPEAQQMTPPKLKRKRQVNPLIPMKRTTR